MTLDISSYGELGLRLSPTDNASLARADELSVNIIGTEFNVLSNMACLGWKAALLSAVPDSPMGEKARSAVRENGVNDELIHVSAEDDRLGIYFVDYGKDPKPTSVYFDRKRTAFTRWEPVESEIEKVLDTRLLHLSGLTLALSETAAETAMLLMTKAKAKGVPVSFDLNYRGKLWDSQSAAKVCLPFIEQADILIAPRSDVNELFGETGNAKASLVCLQDISTAEIIAVTDGDRGAVAMIGGELITELAAPVQIVDRLGAGDGFAAGFLHAINSGQEDVALKSGVQMAALALAQKGEQVAIDRKIFNQIVAGNAGRLQR